MKRGGEEVDNNAPVICNHSPPNLRGRVGDSRAKVWGKAKKKEKNACFR